MGLLGKVFGDNNANAKANEAGENVNAPRKSTSSTSSQDATGIDDNKAIEFEETALSADESSDTDSIKTRNGGLENPFLDPNFATYYRNVYERTKYECRARFDPLFNWSKKEENKLRRKLDFRVTLLACFMFVALQVDRGNLGQAVSDNMLDDLNMTTAEFNTGNTIFYLCFLSAELPSQLVSKKLGADVWIPIQMMSWSIVALAQVGLKNKHGFYACRALLGLLEGGFIPDLVLWLSYFYTSAELSVRLSYFWTTLSLTQIFTSLLAFGILRMRGINGLPGWAWLFLIEGLFTFLIGLSAWFLMVPSAVQTKKRWNPKGWFTEHEEKIIVNKILRDDPTKGDMNNRQGITIKMLYEAISDYHLWPVYIIGIFAYIPTNVLNTYLTLVLRSMGFSRFDVNLLTIPHNVIHIVLLLLITKFSEVVNERSYVCLFQPFYVVPLLGVLRWWKGSMTEKWETWAIATLMLGNPYIHAICVSWCSRNSRSIKNRTVSASLYNMFVQAGSIIASNIYRPDDAPLYHRGNSTLFALACAMFPILLLTRGFYVYINRKREKKWQSMSEEEKEDYIKNTTDEGSFRLDFRFAT
ncbi:hypothetical protein BVG19_g3590 [[Candida] boidinii]|nr:hypothetical protein BVG19_g3590 [[Candida] boidinii]OWB49609.1 hypothetical protein B5S27_g1150 [[Candida] boidinii]